MATATQARSASAINVILGCWLIASPWIYGYATNTAALGDSIAIGIVVAVLATWSSRSTVMLNRSQSVPP